jgi:pimeloyl-ACP methyl ester carboxylesterase
MSDPEAVCGPPREKSHEVDFKVRASSCTSRSRRLVRAVQLRRDEKCRPRAWRFADGSGWKLGADILEHDGFAVFVVREPETSFDADVAATRVVLDRSGPCVLVGHSYGGMIVTEVGNHAAVRSLVYVAAFEPQVR